MRRRATNRAARDLRRGRAGDVPLAPPSGMFGRRRVLLVECLDALGAIPGDAAARERTLDPIAGSIETLVLDLRAGGPHDTGASGRGKLRAELDGVMQRVDPGLVVVASASPASSVVSELLHDEVEVYGWPTAVGAESGRPSRARSRACLLSGSDGEEEPSYLGPAGLHPPGADALNWGIHDVGERGRSQMPLWDGRYLLSPSPLEGKAGHALLRAFAELETRWNRVELVILGAVQPEFRHAARRLGIGGRVHFAGPATPDAELTWLRAACGIVLAHPGPVAASLMLRALSCGAPFLAFGAGCVPTVHGWLADRGVIPLSWASDVLPARAKLEHLLERDRAVEHAVARGRAVAARHTASALTPRLGQALELEPSQRRAA